MKCFEQRRSYNRLLGLFILYFLISTEEKENYILCNIMYFQSLGKKTISDALRIQNLPRIRVQLFGIWKSVNYPIAKEMGLLLNDSPD